MAKVTMKGFTFGLLSDGELVAATALANGNWVAPGDFLILHKDYPHVHRVWDRELRCLVGKGLAYCVPTPNYPYYLYRAVNSPNGLGLEVGGP